MHIISISNPSFLQKQYSLIPPGSSVQRERATAPSVSATMLKATMLKATIIATLLICLSPFSSAYPGSPDERTAPFGLGKIWDNIQNSFKDTFSTTADLSNLHFVDCVWRDESTGFTLGITKGWQERCRDPELKKALEQCGETEIELESESCDGTVKAKDMDCTPKVLSQYLQSQGYAAEPPQCRCMLALPLLELSTLSRLGALF